MSAHKTPAEQYRALAQALAQSAVRMGVTDRQALYIIRNFVPVGAQSPAAREIVIEATFGSFAAFKKMQQDIEA